ncbi:hypothetical protein [Gracilibacillus thailandensis]|uniref:Uncharacterized protein n=1 Tax=Gracilibacillus thailandensis TaxID=563735 RepID=A0A6N7QZZ6_9BACI|nr:hypothetical protein [Gracilibacillus thailandensis]MRI67657.1 hypothetical protein [Gracilibacillus thailandensis]
MKVIINIAILIIIEYFMIDWFIKGIYYFVFKSNQYLSFTSPMMHLSKYFIIGFTLIIFFRKYVTLTQVGKVFSLIVMVILFFSFISTTFWFNAAGEDRIVKHRFGWTNSISWEEVDYIATNIYHEQKVAIENESPFKHSKVKGEYMIHLNDGSHINVWSGISTAYDLHRYIVDQEIEVKYLTESENFDQNFAYYFDDQLEKAHFVFGVK